MLDQPSAGGDKAEADAPDKTEDEEDDCGDAADDFGREECSSDRVRDRPKNSENDFAAVEGFDGAVEAADEKASENEFSFDQHDDHEDMSDAGV